MEGATTKAANGCQVHPRLNWKSLPLHHFSQGITMTSKHFGKVALLVAALVGGTAVTAHAQAGTLSNTATVALSATRAAGITVTPSTAAMTLANITDNSTANNFGSVSIDTYYTLSSGASVTLVGYFGTPAQALANGTNYIPSSKVEGSLDGGTSWSPFSGAAVSTAGVAGGSLTLGSWALPAGGATATQTTALGVRLNLTGTNTVVGTYTGTLNLRAVVQ